VERRFTPDDLRYNGPRFSLESRRRVFAMLDRIRPVATKHGVTLVQLAIAWTVAQKGITHALVGARDPTRQSKTPRREV
jgi:methylglyoxal reductase